MHPGNPVKIKMRPHFFQTRSRVVKALFWWETALVLTVSVVMGPRLGK
jgi:hypothetical protein